MKFLTSAKGQTAAFKSKNNFPSSPQAIDDPAVQGFTNSYFSNAPVGRIFGESVKALKPVYLGPDNLRSATGSATRCWPSSRASSSPTRPGARPSTTPSAW